MRKNVQGVQSGRQRKRTTVEEEGGQEEQEESEDMESDRSDRSDRSDVVVQVIIARGSDCEPKICYIYPNDWHKYPGLEPIRRLVCFSLSENPDSDTPSAVVVHKNSLAGEALRVHQSEFRRRARNEAVAVECYVSLF